MIALTDLSLPEVTALVARARLFVGNDSGIAHIAAAVGAPSVVIFGSSNVCALAALGHGSGRGRARGDGMPAVPWLLL